MATAYSNDYQYLACQLPPPLLLSIALFFVRDRHSHMSCKSPFVLKVRFSLLKTKSTSLALTACCPSLNVGTRKTPHGVSERIKSTTLKNYTLKDIFRLLPIKPQGHPQSSTWTPPWKRYLDNGAVGRSRCWVLWVWWMVRILKDAGTSMAGITGWISYYVSCVCVSIPVDSIIVMSHMLFCAVHSSKPI